MTSGSVIQARAALRDLEQAILRSPPPGVQPEEILGFFDRHRDGITDALVQLIEQVAEQAASPKGPRFPHKKPGEPLRTMSEAQAAAFATKYRNAGGPLPATPQSIRMVLGGRILKLPDEPLAPLVALLGQARSRRTYPDGRWIAEPGDEVYAQTRGFGGTPAAIRGRVEESRGKLRVRVTGSGGFFPMSVKAKTMPYSEQWTVVQDPRPDQLRQEQLAREKEKQEQWKREQEEYEAQGRKRAAEAVAEGEHYLSPDSPLGTVVSDHLTGEIGVLVSRQPWTVIRWEDDGVERTFPDASDTATVGPVDRKSFLPQYRSLWAVLWPTRNSPTEHEKRLIIHLAKELRKIIDGEIRQAGYWGSPSARNKLAAMLQEQLLLPEYLALPEIVKKRHELIADLLDEGTLRSLA